MYALGHKRTCALHHVMSALPPIATAKADSRKRSCLLYPQKQTCAVQEPMSANGQKQTSEIFRDGSTSTWVKRLDVLITLKAQECLQPRQHKLHSHGSYNEPHKTGDHGLRSATKVRPDLCSEKQNR